MDVKEIKEILHHRYPMLLVDRVEKIENDEIWAYKNITANEEVFNGHFPDNPIFPGVLQIEALAQASGLLASSRPEYDRDATILFLGIDKAKFRKMVVPGDKLELNCKIIRIKRGLIKTECKAVVDGEVACEAELTAVLR